MNAIDLNVIKNIPLMNIVKENVMKTARERSVHLNYTLNDEKTSNA